MAAPEMLTKVGFERSKIGSGDKEVGYQIKESSLGSLMGSACLCFLVMGLMVVSMVFDVHFEKKTLHRQLRVEEHHAASKLAQVQMELWSEFHSDIQESHEAKALLRSMNDSYSTLQGNVKNAVQELAAEFSINPVKAEKFADKLLHLVADTQQNNLKHAKHLVDHLVAAGKRSVKLEKHVGHEMLAETKEEKKAMVQDKKDGIDAAQPLEEKEPKATAKAAKGAAAKGGDKAESEDDSLKEMLTGFFFTFNDFVKEFGGDARSKLKPGHAEYDKIAALYTKLKAEDSTLSEEDIQGELEKIDLASVGAALGSGRVLPVQDIVEEIALIPKVPFAKLQTMEEKWKKGELDSVDVFEQLQEMHESNIVPSGWLQMGVLQEEKDEEQAEDSYEGDEKDEEKPETV